MPNSPAAIIDALLALHEAEQRSVFRLMTEGSPYVRQLPPELRGRVKELHDTNGRHVEELAGVIRRLGGVPRQLPAAADPYLQYLSAKFLIAKLLNEKELMRERYDNTLGALPESTPGDIVDLLRRQEAEQAAHVDALAAVAGQALSAAG